MISAPQENKNRAVTRAVIEAILGEVPFAGVLIRIYQETHPPEMKAKIAAWVQEVSDQLNSHSDTLARHEILISQLADRLAPTIRISECATTVGMYLAKQSTSGLRDPVVFTALAAALPEFSDEELKDGIYELQALQLLTTTSGLGIPLRSVRPTEELFWAFDLPALGFNSESDANELAKIVLDNPDRASGRQLEQHTGWSRRRLNPALTRLLQLIDERHVSKELQAQYSAASFYIDDEDKYRLKNFIAASSKSQNEA